jgi:tetratricopeptide (TPR) repeat protein
MSFCRHPAFGLGVLAMGAAACAQTSAPKPIHVNASVAAQHLQKHSRPWYRGRAAYSMEGLVILEATIGTNGHVQEVRLLGGPFELALAGARIVLEYVYTPFWVDGKLSRVTAIVPVNFSFHKDANKAEEVSAVNFFEMLLPCKQKITENAPPLDQLQTCHQVVQQSESFPPNTHMLERRGAYVEYAIALLHSGKYKEAVDAADTAIHFVLQPSKDLYGTVSAYTVAAEAQLATGNLPAASADLATAEKMQRTIIDSLQTSEATMYASPAFRAYVANGLKAEKQQMKALLKMHAGIQQQLGNPKAAEALNKQNAKTTP